MSESIPLRDKRMVAERAQHACEYCLSQLRYSPDPFSVDHIIALAHGGSSSMDNLALACQGCNGLKFTATEAVDPITGQIVPLYNPRIHHWATHFVWAEAYSLILGITPTGRATVAKLQLNRFGVMNLRKVLRPLGKHPPITE